MCLKHVKRMRLLIFFLKMLSRFALKNAEKKLKNICSYFLMISNYKPFETTFEL